jgi:signal transduction histidine kinase
VRIETQDGTVLLSITDDGRGLSVSTLEEGGHHGLGNMRARAKGLGGALELRSTPGSGTNIIATVPMRPSTHRQP